ncbi:hypothetical protein MUG87_05265 [Ectobacillus sp. JY-23]|uniref:hypothetical protein n=1 Tax=Ectobacillus sp. JY-23 TaxID=2933872 RepID=UPI001FF1A7D8|nr:hypothetical protein [Ectobacillus sp. JY-23]UOY93534.1 hypothetical protein MUG87_05265 [Ectobacillus sp. JY-23]
MYNPYGQMFPWYAPIQSDGRFPPFSPFPPGQGGGFPPFPPGGGYPPGQGGGFPPFSPGGGYPPGQGGGFPPFPPGGGYPPGQGGGFPSFPPGGGYPPGQGGGFPSFPPGQESGPPPGPPPSYTPQKPQASLYAVDPGGIRRCLFRYTYIWLQNDRGFWFYPVFVGRTSIAGYRWRPSQFRWVYTGLDLDRIDFFECS